MLMGYARVSKIDQQDTRAQVKALKEAGCKRIFEENASGGRWDRPQLHKALDVGGRLKTGQWWSIQNQPLTWLVKRVRVVLGNRLKLVRGATSFDL